ncbi:hypothetical protein AX16_001687 [Volvariella volvacea WC 439]|nr:hypothetical protein AX16_001687 [Volvariella volvacea WC 439]
MSHDTQQPPRPAQCAQSTRIPPFKYKCFLPTCTFASNERAKIYNHMASHTGDKLFLCVICKKQYSDPSTLLKHQKVTHPRVIFVDANGQETNKRWTNPADHVLLEAYMDMLRKLWDLLKENRLHVGVPEEAHSVTTEDGVTTVKWLEFLPPLPPSLFFVDVSSSVQFNGTPDATPCVITSDTTTTPGNNGTVPDPTISHSRDTSGRGSAYSIPPGTTTPPGMTTPSTPMTSTGTSLNNSTRSSAEPVATTSAGHSDPALLAPLLASSDGRRARRRPRVADVSPRFVAWTPKDNNEATGGTAVAVAEVEVGGVVDDQEQGQAVQRAPQVPEQLQMQSRKRRRVDADDGPNENAYPRLNVGDPSVSNGASAPNGATDTQDAPLKGQFRLADRLNCPFTNEQVDNSIAFSRTSSAAASARAVDDAGYDTTHTNNHTHTDNTIPVTDTTYNPPNTYIINDVVDGDAFNANDVAYTAEMGNVSTNAVLNTTHLGLTPPIEYSHPYESYSILDGIATQPGNISHQVPVDQGYTADPQPQLVYDQDVQYNLNVQNGQSNPDAQYNADIGYIPALSSLPAGMNGCNDNYDYNNGFIDYTDNLDPSNGGTSLTRMTDSEFAAFVVVEAKRINARLYPEQEAMYPSADGGSGGSV